MVQKQEEQYNRDMTRFIRVPQGFMPGEYSTFHTCEALCQEEATYLMCAKALCQEKEYEPRILRAPRLMPAIQSKKKKKRKKKKSHISYVCEGYMPGRGRRRRRFTKSCLSYVNRGRVVKNTRVATHMFAVC